MSIFHEGQRVKITGRNWSGHESWIGKTGVLGIQTTEVGRWQFYTDGIESKPITVWESQIEPVIDGLDPHITIIDELVQPASVRDEVRGRYGLI